MYSYTSERVRQSVKTREWRLEISPPNPPGNGEGGRVSETRREQVAGAGGVYSEVTSSEGRKTEGDAKSAPHRRHTDQIRRGTTRDGGGGGGDALRRTATAAAAAAATSEG